MDVMIRNGEPVHRLLPDRSIVCFPSQESAFFDGQGLIETHLSHSRGLAQTNAVKAQMYPMAVKPRIRRV